MIIILPEPARLSTLNQTFIQFYYEHPEMHLYPEQEYGKVTFIVSGSFAHISYGGEINNNHGILFHNHFVKMFQDYHDIGASIIIDCSSHLITELNNYDVLGNALLTTGAPYGDTGIKVSNNYAYDYFHQKYPNCRMIAAAHYDGDTEGRPFFLRESWNGLENKTTKAPYTAVRINSLCDTCSIEQRLQCLRNEDINVSMYSNASYLYNCTKLHQNIHSFGSETNMMPELINKGQKYFIFPNYVYSPLLQTQEYVKNLIKPEYHQTALNFLMLSI